MLKFNTFMASNEGELNKYIQSWLNYIDGVEVERSAPSVACTPRDENGNTDIVIAVTCTAETKD